MLFPNSQGRHRDYCQWSYGEQPSPPGRLGVHLLLVRRQGTEQGTELAAAACGPTETSCLPVPDLGHSLRETWRLTRSLRLDRRTISPSYWPSRHTDTQTGGHIHILSHPSHCMMTRSGDTSSTVTWTQWSWLGFQGSRLFYLSAPTFGSE